LYNEGQPATKSAKLFISPDVACAPDHHQIRDPQSSRPDQHSEFWATEKREDQHSNKVHTKTLTGAE
jgi:hypothetical protein